MVPFQAQPPLLLFRGSASQFTFENYSFLTLTPQDTGVDDPGPDNPSHCHYLVQRCHMTRPIRLNPRVLLGQLRTKHSLYTDAAKLVGLSPELPEVSMQRKVPWRQNLPRTKQNQGKAERQTPTTLSHRDVTSSSCVAPSKAVPLSQAPFPPLRRAGKHSSNTSTTQCAGELSGLL